MMKNQRTTRSDDHAHKSEPDAHIPIGASFVGDIETKAGIRIDGSVKGNVTAVGNVDIGPDGKVQGALKGSRIHIAGSIRGNVSSSAVVQLLGGAKLIGDLSALSISIEEGASYKGQCTIGKQPDEAPETPNVKQSDNAKPQK
jgi:cytoskeletal protein CcmA (bactofilin family)